MSQSYKTIIVLTQSNQIVVNLVGKNLQPSEKNLVVAISSLIEKNLVPIFH